MGGVGGVGWGGGGRSAITHAPHDATLVTQLDDIFSWLGVAACSHNGPHICQSVCLFPSVLPVSRRREKRRACLSVNLAAGALPVTVDSMIASPAATTPALKFTWQGAMNSE